MHSIMNNFKANNINDIVFGSSEAKDRIFEIVEKRKAFPSFGKNGLLLYGIWGTGKTTLMLQTRGVFLWCSGSSFH